MFFTLILHILKLSLKCLNVFVVVIYECNLFSFSIFLFFNCWGVIFSFAFSRSIFCGRCFISLFFLLNFNFTFSFFLLLWDIFRFFSFLLLLLGLFLLYLILLHFHLFLSVITLILLHSFSTFFTILKIRITSHITGTVTTLELLTIKLLITLLPSFWHFSDLLLIFLM